jgi:hypothetical protein
VKIAILARVGVFSLVVFSAQALFAQDAAARTPRPPSLEELNRMSAADHIAALLETRGQPYSKLGPNAWKISFAGQTVRDLQVGIATSADSVVVWCKLGRLQEFNLTSDILVALLRYSGNIDGAKAVIADDVLMVRYDAHIRTVDAGEFRFILNQVGSGADSLVNVVLPAMKQQDP